MKTVGFGIIGCGLMGKEFASAAARWRHLPEVQAAPEIVSICSRSGRAFEWFRGLLPSIKQATTDYRELLANQDVQAVYCAVPHNLHRQMYCDIVCAGKHLMGEKPFGIDLAAGEAIAACLDKRPGVFARCSSEFVFYPAVQRIGGMVEAGAFGQVIEVNSGFQHSSDLDPAKAINWKRMLEFNGEYGCMGDLGMHACHFPFRAGWAPRNVRAILSNIVTERPDGQGGTAPCETWDNATLLCEAEDRGKAFPLTIKLQRIAPGEKNTWYVEVKGTSASARFSTKNPKRLEVLEYNGGEQAWQQIDMGHETAFKSITGGIFEFGFSDAVLQMWAAFLAEMTAGEPASRFAGCATPEEVLLTHRLFTAALESHRCGTVVAL